MRFANYSRKSVYSDRSDSVKNQARMCREYCDSRYPGQIDTWTEYSDEDYTGANTDRPGLQRMMADVRDGQIDVLVVYQLDRLSRSVRDFSGIYDELERHGVRFLSIKENIDVTTPIGRAMMNISASFAQMEREQTAERVTDNMIGLADKGLWVGGRPPAGYRIEEITLEGRKHKTIVPDPERVKAVVWTFDEFLSHRWSLQQMERELRDRGIRTKTGGFVSTTQLHTVLTSPYCVPACPEVYDYYAGRGCQMVSSRDRWDGTHGVMVYGRTTAKTGSHEKTPPDHWRVCVGLHEPFMDVDKWLAVQSRMGQNKCIKSSKYPPALLKGVLRCSCGRLMGVHHTVCKSGVHSWYYCPRRDREGPEACSMSAVKCETLDAKVLDALREIDADHSQIAKYVRNQQTDPLIDCKAGIARHKAQIDRLTASLALAADSPAAKYIISQIEAEDAALAELEREQSRQDAVRRRRKEEDRTAEQKITEIGRLITGLDGFDAAEKNQIIRSVVRECRWDGQTLFLRL